jgi:hypothetical protein
VYFTGGPGDYAIGGIIAFALGGAATFLMTLLGAWFFGLILGPSAGLGIAEAVRLAVRRRRSRHLWLAVAIGIGAGAVPVLVLALVSQGAFRGIAPLLFAVLAIGAASARLR